MPYVGIKNVQRGNIIGHVEQGMSRLAIAEEVGAKVVQK